MDGIGKISDELNAKVRCRMTKEGSIIEIQLLNVVFKRNQEA